MADPSAEHWYPTAAYLYILHLDGPSLAWEYLRRNPHYRLDWLRRRHQSDAGGRWGLRLLEDPDLDARHAHPAWFPDHDAVMQLYPDADPPPDAVSFTFWRLPGNKSLIHDGKRLILVARWPGRCLRLALAPGLEDGMAYVYGIRARAAPGACCQALMAGLGERVVVGQAMPAATTWPRPSKTALQELHTLQALDATLAGMPLREVAKGLFGADTVMDDWHADSALRARVRRLVRRGDALMCGGYRRLAQLPPLAGGRSASSAKRP